MRIKVALSFGIVSVCSAFILLLGLWLAMFGSAGVAAGMDRGLPQQEEDAEIQPTAVTVPVTWTQRAESGFGLPQGEIEGSGVKGIMALASFDGQLYAGASAWFNYGERRLSRSEDGQAWEEVSGVDFEHWNNYEIASLAVYSGYLYAGTSNYTMEGNSEGAEIWRSPDGVTWSVVVTGGLGDSQQSTIENLAEFDGYLYASTSNVTDTQGAEIWRSVDGEEWEKVVTGGLDDDNASAVRALYVYGDAFYASVSNYAAGAEVWRSEDGLAWTRVLTGGSELVGGKDRPSAIALAAFSDYLYTYVSGGDGVILLRCGVCDGADWESANEPGFGNPDNLYRGSLVATEVALFAIVGNGPSGIEVWRTSDGEEWEQIAAGGFGDADNLYTEGQGSAIVFDDRLYVGTWNSTTGGQIWSIYLGPTFFVEVQRNANLRGGPGTNYAVIGGVKTGDTLEVVGQNEGGTWYQLGNDAWISASLVAKLAPEPDAEADSAPVTPIVPLTATPQPDASTANPAVTSTVTTTENATGTTALPSLLQKAVSALEEEPWRLRSEMVLTAGVTHTLVIAYAPPDRYDLAADEETHIVFIGDDAYAQEGDKWAPTNLSARSAILNLAWLESAAQDMEFIGADELDGQAMLVYRYLPPATDALSANDVKLWLGEQDGRIHKLEILGKIMSTHLEDGVADSEVEYLADAATTILYEYDPEIMVENPVE